MDLFWFVTYSWGENLHEQVWPVLEKESFIKVSKNLKVYTVKSKE